MLRIVPLTLLAIFMGAASLLAQSTDLNPMEQRRARARVERTAEQWQNRLREVGELLEQEKWNRARRKASNLCEEMSERVIGGFEAHRGSCLALRAVARMATGEEEDARWDWELAQQLWDTLGPEFVAGFGEVGARLNAVAESGAAGDAADQAFPADDPYGSGEPHQENLPAICTMPLCAGEKVQPPNLIKKVEPDYPHGARVGQKEDFVIVMVVVGTDGRPRHPRILKTSPAATLTYRALEALRQWRFEPARVGGRAVDVFYSLTVNFNLSR